ncbi:MAG: hypothetical protein S4CHLAM20_00660 [Chlamydiia bacterium]|nr:hypothetical protein [Chlamydiia bacterium]
MDKDNQLTIDKINLSSDDHKRLLFLSSEEVIFDQVIQIFCQYGYTKSIIEYEMINASNYVFRFLDQIEVDKDVLMNQIRHLLEIGDGFLARIMHEVSVTLLSFDEMLKFVAELCLIYSKYIQNNVNSSSLERKLSQVIQRYNMSEDIQENLKNVFMNRTLFKSIDEKHFIKSQRLFMILLAALSYK